jgi:hypothetical protein
MGHIHDMVSQVTIDSEIAMPTNQQTVICPSCGFHWPLSGPGDKGENEINADSVGSSNSSPRSPLDSDSSGVIRNDVHPMAST